MIEVRIREEYQAWSESVYLMDVFHDSVDNVIPMLERWGIAGYESNELSGQFVYDNGRAFFEVVIHEVD